MSGDVVLIDSGDGAVSRLVRTAAALFDRADFNPAALVGGLAVTVRLATAHRATNDVDTVTDGDGPRTLALEYLADAAAAASGRIEIDGVKVDVMPTWPLPALQGELPDDELDRLFVLGHRWALESATSVVVKIITPNSTEATETGALLVATSPALIACKFHALARRRGPRISKQESDALDLFCLITELVRSDQEIANFVGAPFDIGALVETQVQRWFIDDTLRLARLASRATFSGDRIDVGEVETLGRLFIARLRR